jgi:hypothetical protein
MNVPRAGHRKHTGEFYFQVDGYVKAVNMLDAAQRINSFLRYTDNVDLEGIHDIHFDYLHELIEEELENHEKIQGSKI